MKITLENFCNQWKYNGGYEAFVKHFERLIFDFTTKAGNYSKMRFSSSFESKSFAGVGPAWKPRRWQPRKKKGKDNENQNEEPHALMDDFGTLKAGIKGYQPKFSETFRDEPPSPISRRIYTKGSYYHIYTHARTTAREKAHRGLSTKSNNSYAAVHNTDPKLGVYKVNQRPGAGAPEQRQFIGFHPSIDEYIAGLIPEIFSQFPFPQK